MGYIYLITNKINGMKYIGQTTCEDVQKRWKQHRTKNSNSVGRFLKSAYEKYGYENFKYQIVCICFNEDCDKYEEDYIKKFNTMAPNGYNLREGGVNSKFSEETKRLQREATTRRMADPERRMKSSQKGEKHPNYGKKYTDVEKEVLRQKQKAYWANLSHEKRRELLEKRKVNYKTKGATDKQYSGLKIGRGLSKKKAVGKYNENGELQEQYSSVSHASSSTGICRMTINNVCLNKPRYKTAGGFVWKFI
jgi:group I intron endonuclease